MKKIFIVCLLVIVSCGKEQFIPHNYAKVEVEEIYTADSVSIRAITLMQGNLGFAGSNNTFGIYNTPTNEVLTQKIKYDTIQLDTTRI